MHLPAFAPIRAATVAVRRGAQTQAARWPTSAEMPQERLTERERAPLVRWERWMLRSFLLALGLIAAILVLRLALGVRQAYLAPLGVLLLGVIGAGVVLQLSARCPRCRVRLGLYTRLLLPQCCPRCQVGFRPPTRFERRMGVDDWDEP